MITPEIRAEMRRLVLVEHWLIETVARRFGVHHSVVRRALKSTASERCASSSVLDPFKPYIVERLTTHPELSAVRLLAELRERGYPQGIAVVRRYVAKVRAPRPRKAYLRVEMEPAEQAQVDWGSFGWMRVGTTQRPLSVFAMVLSYSRALFLDFSFDQKMDTFLRMHRRALEFFGGIPRRILYDNLKSVVLHHIGSTVQFNPRFLAFAAHYLFEPSAAPVRYPEAKGRVESSIKYIRSSFFYGRSFASLSDLREQTAAWRDQTANTRLHATTRERPVDRLLLERTRLRPLPEHPFDTDLVLSPLIVSKEARVRLDTNTYSVPPTYVGRTVELRADDHQVRVVCDGTLIAQHHRSYDRRRAIEDPAHLEALLARRPAGRPSKRKDRIANLSPECRTYLHEVARRRFRLDSEVDKLVRLCDRYGETEVAAAITCALGHRTFGASYVRTLCDQARFARGLSEPEDPIQTGNPFADALTVEPHDLETYDALFESQDPPGTSSEHDASDTHP